MVEGVAVAGGGGVGRNVQGVGDLGEGEFAPDFEGDDVAVFFGEVGDGLLDGGGLFRGELWFEPGFGQGVVGGGGLFALEAAFVAAGVVDGGVADGGEGEWQVGWW